MNLTKEQEQAVKILKYRLENNEKVSVLQGPAGSGKSYLLSFLIQYHGYQENEVAFATFTGTAAKILMGQGLNASTIHKLIYNPIMRDGECIGFGKKTLEELAHLKLIVVDEFSMVSQVLLKDLMSYKIPLILVGDQYQLPPIGEPNRFIQQSDAVLTEPMRQALDNPILWAANEVRLQKNLSYGVHGNDQTKILVTSKHQLDSDWLRDDVRIITGLNKTRQSINLQMAGTTVPLSGHKIIFLKNDWNNFITNGTMATIKNLKPFGAFGYKLDFETTEEDHYYDYHAEFQKQSKPMYQFFDFSYAITCHKAQGATYDSPGLIFDESYVFGQDKYRWLYTAISRFTGNYNLVIVK